jgi:hypothetical protein
MAAFTSAQTVESPIAQRAEQPALDDAHHRLDLGLISRPPGPRRQHCGLVVRRHLGVGAVDLGFVEAGLITATLGLSGTSSRGAPLK